MKLPQNVKQDTIDGSWQLENLFWPVNVVTQMTYKQPPQPKGHINHTLTDSSTSKYDSENVYVIRVNTANVNIVRKIMDIIQFQ